MMRKMKWMTMVELTFYFFRCSTLSRYTYAYTYLLEPTLLQLRQFLYMHVLFLRSYTIIIIVCTFYISRHCGNVVAFLCFRKKKGVKAQAEYHSRQCTYIPYL